MVAFRPAEGLPQPAAATPSALVAPVSLAVHAAAAYDQNELAFRLAQISIGQQLTAQVQARLADGNYLVQVADTVVQMSLPDTVKTGEQIQVTLIEKQPKPTFLLSSEVPPPVQESSIMTLSPAARLVTSLLQAAQHQAGEPVTSATPLVATPQAAPATMAEALQTALAQLGLFYEAHLAQWVAGQRSLPSLLAEPQAGQTTQMLGIAPQNSSQPGTLAENPVLIPAGQPSTSPPSAPAQPASGPAILTHLVQQQLQVLDQNRIVWQGMAWPGQNMDWQIEERQSDSSSSPPQEQPSVWNSRLRLDLPGLGTVEADIRLHNGHFGIRIRTDQAGSAERLRAAQAGLNEAFGQAGLALDSVQVRTAADQETEN